MTLVYRRSGSRRRGGVKLVRMRLAILAYVILVLAAAAGSIIGGAVYDQRHASARPAKNADIIVDHFTSRLLQHTPSPGGTLAPSIDVHIGLSHSAVIDGPYFPAARTEDPGR